MVGTKQTRTGRMEGTNAEHDDPPKEDMGADQKQREKSTATRNPSQSRKISKLSLSKTQHYIKEQKRLMEQEAETGGIDECYEIAGESQGLIPSVPTDASGKDGRATDDFDHESDEDGSDQNDGKIMSSQNSGSGRQRISRDFVSVAKVSLKLKPDEQKTGIVRIFRTEMNKSGANFEKTDPGNWEDCTKLGGWTRIHVRKCTCPYIHVYYEFRSSHFEYELFL